MNTQSANRRRDYRHFPDAYARALAAFDASPHGTFALGPMSARDAEAARRDLYRYKTFLSAAVDHAPDDAYAAELHRIFTRAILRVEPVATGVDDGLTHLVVFALNPVVAALERKP